jgi:hypothetical protein
MEAGKTPFPNMVTTAMICRIPREQVNLLHSLTDILCVNYSDRSVRGLRYQQRMRQNKIPAHMELLHMSRECRLGRRTAGKVIENHGAAV